MDNGQDETPNRRQMLLRVATLVGAAVALAACQHTASFSRSEYEEDYKNKSRPAPPSGGG